MGLAAAVPAIIGAGASIFGAHKQSQAQNKALDAQERGRREELAYARQQQESKRRADAFKWKQYNDAMQQYYARYGDRAIDRYGIPVGIKIGQGAAPGPGGQPAPGGAQRAPVTMAGGRQVGADEYDAYVRAREARRGGTLGQIAGV